jgi:hypothetical protein
MKEIMMIKDNRNEIIEALREQNIYWGKEYHRVDVQNVWLRIALTLTTLISIFGCSWVISDLIGMI